MDNITSLQITDVKVGTGAEAKNGQQVSVHYTGWLHDPKAADKHGKKFDSSKDHGEPFEFKLGGGQVIRGWDQGVAGMPFRGVPVVWPIYAPAALGSAVGAFDLPARNALVPSLVPREHLPNAISLNTTMFQTASVVGPSLGGIFIAATGVGWVYVAN